MEGRAIEGEEASANGDSTRNAALVLVQALLARGADPNARIATSAVVLGYLGTPRRGAFEQNAVGTGDVRGATPLWVAGFSANGGGLFGENSAYQFDSSAEIMQALLDGGADHRLTTDDGTTAADGRRRDRPPLVSAAKASRGAVAERGSGSEESWSKRAPTSTRPTKPTSRRCMPRRSAGGTKWSGTWSSTAPTSTRATTGGAPRSGWPRAPSSRSSSRTGRRLRICSGSLGADTRLGIPGTVHERADRDVAVGHSIRRSRKASRGRMRYPMRRGPVVASLATLLAAVGMPMWRRARAAAAHGERRASAAARPAQRSRRIRLPVSCSTAIA